jgi:hypothetical protein
LLVDTEGLVLKAKIHVANVVDQEGRGWVEKVLGWTVDLVERPRKPAPEEVLKAWAAEWAKEGKEVDWQKMLPLEAFRCCRGDGWWSGRFLGSTITGG